MAGDGGFTRASGEEGGTSTDTARELEINPVFPGNKRAGTVFLGFSAPITARQLNLKKGLHRRGRGVQ